jgi:hypothetical protein
MGERAKNEEMKSRKTNLEPAERDKAGVVGPDAEDAMDRPATPHRHDVRLGREVQARIGQQLRAMYEDFVNQGVPQHISDLVRRLSEQD